MNPKIIKGRVRSLLLLAPTVLLFTSCDFIQDITKDWTNGEASFIPTPIEVVDRMLELAQVSKNDVVYDLGSGDGRIVIKAAKEYGARGVGRDRPQVGEAVAGEGEGRWGKPSS